MTRVPDIFDIAGSGSTLIGPFEPGTAASVLLRAPTGARCLELRGVAAEATTGASHALRVDGDAHAQVDGLEVPNGIWLRVFLKTGAEPPVLSLRLEPDNSLRLVLARITRAPQTTPRKSFAGLSRLPQARPVETPDNPALTAQSLAALMRKEAATAIETLSRLPTAFNHTIIDSLLQSLADDPGEDPSAYLPFLVLLAQNRDLKNASCDHRP